MKKYKDTGFLDIKKNIKLTQDTSTGKIYVKKYLTSRSLYEIYTTLKQCNFEGVPKIFDLFFEDNCYVLIEEYIEGKTLQQLLDEKSMIFTPDRVEEIVCFLCKTLRPIHKAGIVHRDITAANIMYSCDNRIYLIDFGNSRTHKSDRSTDTEFIGTQNYAAPEQFGFGQSDHRTDIYAIGVLMNVLLTGGKYPYEQFYNGSFTKVIRRCTAVKPNERYNSVAALNHALFSVTHKSFNAVSISVICVLAAAFAAVFVIRAVLGMAELPKQTSLYTVTPITTSTPEEKAYRRWSDIENCIADGDYDEAQRRLDEAVSEGLTGYNIYMLYSKNYEAQQMYDDAAEILFYYLDNISDIEIPKESPIFIRLTYLYPNCSDSMKNRIDELSEHLAE